MNEFYLITLFVGTFKERINSTSEFSRQKAVPYSEDILQREN